MSTPHDPERSDQPRIPLDKPGPGTQQPPPAPAAPPAPGAGWTGQTSAPPPPPPGYGPQPGGSYPFQHHQQGTGHLGPAGSWGPVGSSGSRLSPDDERTWAGAAHWSALIASFVVLAFLGPLLVLLVKGGDSPFVRRQAVESLNFQLTIHVAALVSFALVFVLVGILLLPLVGVAWLVFTIIGAVKASSGEDYRYPLSIRMVR